MEDKALEEAVGRWEQEKPLYKQLPIKYKTGVTFTEIEGKCLVCSTPIPNENLHGVIYRPIETVATVEALGWCKGCNTLTPFSFRVRGENGELSLEWLDKKRGWLKSKTHKSFFDKLLKWVL